MREMCKSKIQRLTVTQAELFYEGSITIDRDLLNAADILPHEKVQVVNQNNGERLETYVIEGEPGSGTIRLNGPAARLGYKGDKIIVISYAVLSDEEAKKHHPTLVFVDDENKIKQIK